MLYARKITEDGWFGKEQLDADSVSELGTTNHELSVWKISDISDNKLVDNIALALALTKSKIEEFYMVFLDPEKLKEVNKWVVEFIPQDGNTRYSFMKGEHTNFVVPTFWEQGYLAIYINEMIQDECNYIYYDAAKIKKMAYDAMKEGTLLADDIKKDGAWKNAIKEMEAIYGKL